MYKRQDADITRLYANDALTASETVAVRSTLANRNNVGITNSTVTYLVWDDANANGVFDAGDTWIDSAGNLQAYDAAAVSRTSVVSVAATSSATDSWGISNKNFPVAGLYTVSATWRASSGFLIGTNAYQFYSPGGPWPDMTLTKQLHAGQASRCLLYTSPSPRD